MMSSQPVIKRYLDSRSSKPRVKPNDPQPPSWGGLTKFLKGEPSLSVLNFKFWNGFDLFQYFDWGRVFFLESTEG